MTRVCGGCGEPYEATTPEQKYCSNECKRYAYHVRRYGRVRADEWLQYRRKYGGKRERLLGTHCACGFGGEL